MSFLEITLILLFQSWYKASSCSNCALCSGVREGKYLNIISTAFMSAKLRQSPDFTKGLQDVLGRKGIKHRFCPKQMKRSALFRLDPLNMVKKSTQNESTTLENEPSQVQKKTTNNALLAHELRASPISSRERKIVPSWWYVFTLVMKKAYAHEGKIRWLVGGDTKPCRAGFLWRLNGYASLLYEAT